MSGKCQGKILSWKSVPKLFIVVEYLHLYGYLVHPVSSPKPNTHRRRRRDETVLSRRRRRCVHEFATSSRRLPSADGFGDVNAADGRDQVYNSAANAML